jgi:hypothetical protein
MSHKMFPVFMNDDRCGKMLGLEPVASGKKVKKIRFGKENHDKRKSISF